MDNKIWSLLVHLSMRQWPQHIDIPFKDEFEDDFWDYLVDESAKAGMNAIFLDLGDAVEYASHPEIATEGAWTRKKVRNEIKKCREKGIALIPKLNFSCTHSYWLGEYRNMTSTTTYYKVCNDLIKEVYELFDHPEYIHIGMDEENVKDCFKTGLVVSRVGELYWHDLRFLIDCVADTGAKPWVWSCPLFEDPEGFKAHIDADDAIIQPWYYHALYEEHFTRTDSTQERIDFYFNNGRYAGLGLEYVEEDPFHKKFRTLAIPLMKEEGYQYVPAVSVCSNCEYNTPDMFRYFKENAPDEQVLGYMAAPWCTTEWKNKEKFDETFKLFKDAKEKYYK